PTRQIAAFGRAHWRPDPPSRRGHLAEPRRAHPRFGLQPAHFRRYADVVLNGPSSAQAVVGRPGPLRSLPPQPWVTLSLLVAVLLLALSGTPPGATLLHLFALTALLFVSLRWPIAPLAALA